MIEESPSAVIDEELRSRMGQAAVQAGLGSDMPLLMAVTLICAALAAAGNLTADILYGQVDPRIRKGGAQR